jgi:hypothetical protein
MVSPATVDTTRAVPRDLAPTESWFPVMDGDMGGSVEGYTAAILDVFAAEHISLRYRGLRLLYRHRRLSRPASVARPFRVRRWGG